MESQNLILFLKLVTRYCGNSYSASTAVGDFLLACEETPRKILFSDHLVTSLVLNGSLSQDYVQLNTKLKVHLTKASLKRAVGIYLLFRITLYPLVLTQWLSPTVSLEDLFHLPCLSWNTFCVFSFTL